MPSAGAAMCTPIRTRPSDRCSTENASSISVVVMSSIENALTSARGRSSGSLPTATAGKPVPCGKYSARKRASCSARADGMPPQSSIRRAGDTPRASAAASSALYSIEFLSGFVSRPSALPANASGSLPAFSSSS